MPRSAGFEPVGGKGGYEEMTADEFESIRLIDHLRFSQEECARQMNVARTTVQAIYESARGKLADALIGGKGIRIQGGSVELCPHARGCCGKSCRRRAEGGPCPSGDTHCPDCSGTQKGE